MKGMLDFLERAGLVKNDAPAEPMPAAPAEMPSQRPVADTPTVAHDPANLVGLALDMDAIYNQSGVKTSIYPAERLLRLLDGLSAMDAATRLMAVQAMDAADESWTIADPLADAAAKAAALSAHAIQLESNLQALDAQSLARIESINSHAEKVVGDIRKQIAELEALAAREQARAAQESAEQQSQLNAARDQTARELGELRTQSQRLQGLAALFAGTTTSTAKD